MAYSNSSIININNYKFKNFNYSKAIRIRKKKLLTSRFSSTSTYKFNKFHKIRFNFMKFNVYTFNSISIFINKGCNILGFSGFFRKNYIKNEHIKSIRGIIRKPYSKIYKFFRFPFFAYSRKPSGLRMGKGKGSKVVFRMTNIRPGSSIININRRINFRFTDTRTVFKFYTYSFKFPFRFKFQIGGF